MFNHKDIFFGVCIGIFLGFAYNIVAFVDMPTFVSAAAVLTVVIAVASIFYVLSKKFKIQVLRKPPKQPGENLNISFDIFKRFVRKIVGLQEKSRTQCPVDEIEKKVKQAIQRRQIDCMIQPIVSLQDRTVKYYCCFLRIKKKQENQALLRLARQSKEAVYLLDKILFNQVVNIIRSTQRKNRDITLFCNFSPETILDEKFYGRLVQATTRESALRKTLVLGLNAIHLKTLEAKLLCRIDLLAKLGFCFVVDELTEVEALDLGCLEAFCFRFANIGITTLNRAISVPQGDRKIVKFYNSALGANVTPIVTGVQAIEEFEMARQFNFSLGQGRYFCAPVGIKITEEVYK